ncbi:MAG: hypothetical protein M3Z29_09615 [Pseudomonadota bacterium]|nr:hypothetical protein [Pseudomonadota bacterium]
MSISPGRLGTLIWALIYGGLFGISIGVALQGNGQAYGWGVVGVGAAAVLAGAVLVWIRSKMSDTDGWHDPNKLQ